MTKNKLTTDYTDAHGFFISVYLCSYRVISGKIKQDK